MERKCDWASVDSNDAEGTELDLDEATDSPESSSPTKKKKTNINEKDQATKGVTSTRHIYSYHSSAITSSKQVNRVQNPGKSDQPRAKRTSEEVATELEMKEQLLAKGTKTLNGG